MIRHLVNLADLTPLQIETLLQRAIADKALFRQGRLPATLERKTLAMVFEKPSLRTRVSFETAMSQLGGHAIYLAPADIGLATREPVRDVARVLGRMCDGIVARTFAHETIGELARWATVPVINALSDHSHPCQALADVMTIREHFARTGDNATLKGKTLVFVGDGNNVARGLAVACGKLGMRFVLAAPEGYELADPPTGGQAGAYRLVRDPRRAAADADVLYTDTWVSMGQEAQKEQRVRDLDGYRLDASLLAEAPGGAIVLHCLPAYRGLEITDEVFEAHAETILDQAENRLHLQRTLLNLLIAEGGIA